MERWRGSGGNHFDKTNEAKGSIEGKRHLGKRITSFVEMACADGADGYAEALNALRRLEKEIESRQKTGTEAA